MTNSVRVNQTNLPEVVADLEGGLMNELNERDRSFINDLINGKWGFHKRNGKLSEKQIHWVEVLYKKALGVEPEQAAAQNVGNLEGLVNLFTLAKSNLKYPKIVLEVSGYPLKLSLAGPNSKYKGSVLITDGGPYGSNKWYGAVSPEGEWTPSKQVTEELRGIIARTLNAFSKDAKHAAMTYGHMSSNCCFCNKQLDTTESVEAGYGPVCADKWGLPWGTKS